MPKLFTLRGDPFERGDDGGAVVTPPAVDRAFVVVPSQAVVANWLESFKEFLPRQKAATFGIDQVMDKLMPTRRRGQQSEQSRTLSTDRGRPNWFKRNGSLFRSCVSASQGELQTWGLSPDRPNY